MPRKGKWFEDHWGDGKGNVQNYYKFRTGGLTLSTF